jgi:hypothetical protein
MITLTVFWPIATPFLELWCKKVGARGKQENSPSDFISIVSTLTRERELLTSGSLFLTIKRKLKICGDAWRRW